MNQIDVSNPMLLNSRETAQMLSISERSLWTLMKAKSIPHVRIGRSVRYDRKDLRAWIEQQKQNNLSSNQEKKSESKK